MWWEGMNQSSTLSYINTVAFLKPEQDEKKQPLTANIYTCNVLYQKHIKTMKT